MLPLEVRALLLLDPPLDSEVRALPSWSHLFQSSELLYPPLLALPDPSLHSKVRGLALLDPPLLALLDPPRLVLLDPPRLVLLDPPRLVLLDPPQHSEVRGLALLDPTPHSEVRDLALLDPPLQ